MNVAICQLPDELSPDSLAWARFVRRVERGRADLIVMNEMPFGPWISREAAFDLTLAAVSIDAHQAAIPALCKLPSAVICSRPIRNQNKLANEAFLVADGIYQPIHHKQYFPQEPGFFEGTWFSAGRPGFDAVEYRGVRFGVLLCTEIMFTEWARHYRRQGVHVIVVPRASGVTLGCWQAAARMAAIVSGCYVLSSNRASQRNNVGPPFGGTGFAYSPTGELLQETWEEMPLVGVDIDLDLVARAQHGYPCYVPELAESHSK